MAIPVEIVFEPPAEIVAAAFFAFSIDIRSFHEPLKRSVQRVMAPSLQHNFEVGGRPPWPELAEGTINQKSGNDQILVNTGLLAQVAGQLNLWTIDMESASIQSMPRAEYGMYHQEGTSHMPQREWAVIQPEDIESIDDVFGLWFEERLVAAGFLISAGELL